MKTSIYRRHRFHPSIIRRAVWMYFRFNLSFRDVEELMIERGVDISYYKLAGTAQLIWLRLSKLPNPA